MVKCKKCHQIVDHDEIDDHSSHCASPHSSPVAGAPSSSPKASSEAKVQAAAASSEGASSSSGGGSSSDSAHAALIEVQINTKLDRYDIVLESAPAGSLGIMFETYNGINRYPYALQVEGVVPESVASKFRKVARRDLLVAINGTQLASMKFSEVGPMLQKAIQSESTEWPCKLQFLQHLVKFEVELSTKTSLGLGLQCVEGEYAIEVENIVAGSAAEATRIVPGDLLTHINGKALAGVAYKDTASILMAEKSASVTIKLGFLHRNNREPPPPPRAPPRTARQRVPKQPRHESIELQPRTNPSVKPSWRRTFLLTAIIIVLVSTGPLRKIVPQIRQTLWEQWESFGGWGAVHALLFTGNGRYPYDDDDDGL
eukprot:g1115.t1